MGHWLSTTSKILEKLDQALLKSLCSGPSWAVGGQFLVAKVFHFLYFQFTANICVVVKSAQLNSHCHQGFMKWNFSLRWTYDRLLNLWILWILKLLEMLRTKCCCCRHLQATLYLNCSRRRSAVVVGARTRIITCKLW